MRMIRLLPVAVLLTSCTGTTYDQGNPIDVDTAAEADADTDTDTDTDADTDTDTDTDPDVELCTNAWHPIHVSGWSKSFTALYEGASGTATEQGLGLSPSAGEGESLYQYRDAIYNEGGEGYDVNVTVACDPAGQEGMYMQGWSGQYSYMIFDIIPVTDGVDAIHSSPRRYLSPEYAVGAEGSWEYDYTLQITQYPQGGKPAQVSRQVSGVYQDAGFVTITLFDGTSVEAYKLTNNFLMMDEFGQQQDGYIEQYWVKGLGLVRESFEDQTQGTILMEKELSSYSGLSIE